MTKRPRDDEAVFASTWRKESCAFCICRCRECYFSSIGAPIMDGQLTRSDELCAIVDSFQPGIVHAIGYGSGVFVQQPSAPTQPPVDVGAGAAAAAAVPGPSSATDDQPMIDLILTVSDSSAFHRHMLERYPDHYSALARLCGPTFCTNLQRSERYGAGVYFNPLVDSPVTTSYTCSSNGCKRKIKYGIVQTEDLVHDLINWRWLYLAGRMQKPTVSVDGLEECERIALAQKQNLDMALAASLLILGGRRGPDGSSPIQASQKYPLTSLFEEIAGLSYAGDPRMDVGGEDPDKVSKLVRSDGQERRFYDLYKQSMESLQDVGILDVVGTGSSRLVAIDLDDSATRRHLWKSLPQKVNKGTCYGVGIETRHSSAQHLSKCLVNIVRPAARRQSLKGLLTAGFVKSVQYASAKFAKGAFRS